jgi:hypothetical protein
MVNMYMGDKMTSSKHTLAVTLGHPAHTRHGEDDEVEAQRRIRDTFQKILPEWNPNDINCGHKVCCVFAAAAALCICNHEIFVSLLLLPVHNL